MQSIIMLICLLGSATGLAQDASERGVLAKDAFDQGEFDQAIQHYEAILTDGIANGHLYYNLGLAYYRNGRTGNAMAAFLGARSLLPRNPDVRANLKSLVGSIPDKLEVTQERSVLEIIAFWVPALTMRELMLVTTLAALFSAGLYWLALLRLDALRRPALASVILPLLLLGSCFLKDRTASDWGAVISESTRAYSGPGDNNTLVFALSEGAPFVKLDETDDWYKIEISGGKRGWLAKRDVAVYRQ